MKRIAFLIIAACVFISTAAFGQPNGDWKEKIMAEKIAFLTAELSLTPQEAQTFWPVYNQISKEKDEATKEVLVAYKAMREAVESGKSKKEISSLLDKYIAATEKQSKIENGAGEKYKTVLPVDKVAKLFIGEEKFRRQHIRKMHHPSGPQNPGVRK